MWAECPDRAFDFTSCPWISGLALVSGATLAGHNQTASKKPVGVVLQGWKCDKLTSIGMHLRDSDSAKPKGNGEMRGRETRGEEREARSEAKTWKGRARNGTRWKQPPKNTQTSSIDHFLSSIHHLESSWLCLSHPGIHEPPISRLLPLFVEQNLH